MHTRSEAGVHPNSLPPGWICPRISKLSGFAVGVSVHLVVSPSVSDHKPPAPLETLPVPSASTLPAHPRVDRDVPTAATGFLHPSVVLGFEMISEHEDTVASSFGAELLMGARLEGDAGNGK